MKLISPNGELVSATSSGAQTLLARGYEIADGSIAVPATDGRGWPDTHAGLDALAATVDGFEWPPPPDGKKKLTVDEKIAALKAAGITPGEGQ